MDKKYEDMSYKEVHGKLEEAMQDLYTSDEAGPFRSPEIDYSFMEGKKKSGVPFKSRFNKVAAIIVIFLLGANIVMMATGSGVIYGEKGLLHRIYEGARGIFTDVDESEYVEYDEIGNSYIINDYDKIKEAKKIWNDILLPNYIPKGIAFSELKIVKNTEGKFHARCEFVGEDETLILEIVETIENRKITSNKSINHIELEDRQINFYYDEINQYYIADIYFEDITLYITSNISLEELENVVISIK